MNESSNGNIREHLTTHEDVNELLRIFEERKEKQTFSAHILAHLNPRNAYAKYTDHGSVKEIFDFFAQYLSGNDLTAIKTDYVKYKKQKGDFSTPTLWEKGIVDD